MYFIFLKLKLDFEDDWVKSIVNCIKVFLYDKKSNVLNES